MNKQLKLLYSYHRDTADPWGDAMGFMFGIAHTVYYYKHETPKSWMFTPGRAFQNLTDEPDTQINELIETREINLDDLIHAGNVFIRYINYLVKKGYGY